MERPWRADRHRLGWAVYRDGPEKPEVFKLPNRGKAMIFPHQHVAAVWAKILNEQLRDM